MTIPPGTQRNHQAKTDVFNAYGAKCFYCDEADFKLLRIKQADQSGYVRRGPNLYLWLRTRKFPTKGFKLVCAAHLYVQDEIQETEIGLSKCACPHCNCKNSCCGS